MASENLFPQSQDIRAVTDSPPPRVDISTIKGVIFDLDDTLVLSTVDYARFKRRIIERIASAGKDDPRLYNHEEGIISLISRYKERMSARGETADWIAAELAEFDRIMDYVELERVHETREIPGARELLATLKAHSIKTGILTRGCGEYVKAVLDLTDLAQLVDAVECRNSHVPPKPNPEPYWRLVERLGLRPEETVFVGDHHIDIACARNAGVPFIGVMTGDLSDRELRDAGSAEVFESVAQISEWARSTLKKRTG